MSKSEERVQAGNAEDLVNRLRGEYKLGDDGEFGARHFEMFIPPICSEAANRIEDLENMLRKKLDLIKCAVAHNYSGDPYQNRLYTEAEDVVLGKRV